MSNNTKNSKFFFPWGMPQEKKGELTLHTFSDTTKKPPLALNRNRSGKQKVRPE
ncbi:Uncharacterised protein [Porphyromonas cangingivalis]|uniref:Uncharacterized protein n=1 Tax=Porphyromonas cangingivalis TaxID=36874 RepID=A0A1T4M9Z7_PORCN|nr:hypothetical protein SAMN02745205_01454 [Porphyromonas cangingivalis]VEJ02403.1 Uncharacterised protein [Porphyromonas cangingivalis]